MQPATNTDVANRCTAPVTRNHRGDQGEGSPTVLRGRIGGMALRIFREPSEVFSSQNRKERTQKSHLRTKLQRRPCFVFHVSPPLRLWVMFLRISSHLAHSLSLNISFKLISQKIISLHLMSTLVSQVSSVLTRPSPTCLLKLLSLNCLHRRTSPSLSNGFLSNSSKASRSFTFSFSSPALESFSALTSSL